jgi:Holliday junction resolvase
MLSFSKKSVKNLAMLKVQKNIKKSTKLNMLKSQVSFTAEHNKKVARTRRQRGYTWEDTLVKRFNALDSWRAFRLGSPSVALPDILAVSSTENTIFTIEAKSGTGTTLHVPYDQIIRCLKWIHTFERYETRKTIIAFKFLSKKRIGTGKYEHRQLREFYKTWDESNKITDFVCTYDGETYALVDGRRHILELEDYQMPFILKNLPYA